MTKALVVDPEKCNGCRLCEKACSLKHYGVEDPERSRIRIDEWEGLFFPRVCHQCEDAPCMTVCPTNSRRRDRKTGMTVVDHKRCIACKTCVAVCPFGACSYDRVTGQVVTCDLCGGDPQCVKVCEPGAVRYVEKGDIYLNRQLEAAGKLGGVAGRRIPEKTPRN